MKKLTKTNILLWIVMFLSMAGVQQAMAQSPAQKFADSPAIGADNCSVIIIDLEAKNVIDAHNKHKPLVPASINKALTIASTISKVDPNSRYHTKVYLGGKVHDGVLDGNLIIVGGGDPTLGTPQGPKGGDFIADIVKALRDKKVETIKGGVHFDSSIFPGPATIPTWHSGDLNNSYGTGCHGFNWQHNAVGKSAVHDPEAKFRQQLTTALAKAGITVQAEDMPDDKHGKPIVDFKSQPLKEIMRYCMMQSDNLYAETFLRTLALQSGKDATPTNGASLEMDYWKKKHVDTSDINVADGSGLSRSNRLTAEFLADVLVKMSDNVEYVSFFPLVGAEGTVRSFLKNTPLQEYMALKTGSMNGIQCYAGYKLDDDFAPTHVVVIMMNSMPQGRDAAKSAVKEMLLETFKTE
ncbi:MAG: D-alanyl-D-alanine carboxypeptidase [Muribaculaceae bacterium]|nr:D-alanyl-D-alanine carboxypeptidase [Muribaculaceae bacterium]